MSPSLPWWPPPGQLQLPHISLLWLPFILHSSWWTGFQRTQLLFVIRTHCECFTLTYWDSGLISLTILAFLSCIMPGWFLPWGLHINLEMYQCLSFIALTQASSHSCLPCKLYIKIGLFIYIFSQHLGSWKHLSSVLEHKHHEGHRLACVHFHIPSSTEWIVNPEPRQWHCSPSTYLWSHTSRRSHSRRWSVLPQTPPQFGHRNSQSGIAWSS